jgi:hypothetical protein
VSGVSQVTGAIVELICRQDIKDLNRGVYDRGIGMQESRMRSVVGRILNIRSERIRLDESRKTHLLRMCALLDLFESSRGGLNADTGVILVQRTGGDLQLCKGRYALDILIECLEKHLPCPCFDLRPSLNAVLPASPDFALAVCPFVDKDI